MNLEQNLLWCAAHIIFVWGYLMELAKMVIYIVARYKNKSACNFSNYPLFYIEFLCTIHFHTFLKKGRLCDKWMFFMPAIGWRITNRFPISQFNALLKEIEIKLSCYLRRNKTHAFTSIFVFFLLWTLYFYKTRFYLYVLRSCVT